MNKTALGTIFGAALLPFFKEKGSKVRIAEGKFYQIIIEDVFIRASKNALMSNVGLVTKIKDNIRNMVLGDGKDKDFIKILKPVIFDREKMFGYSFSVDAKDFYPFGCVDDEMNEEEEEEEEEEDYGMEVCKWQFSIIFSSVRNISNLTENEDDIIIEKIENLIADSISSCEDRDGYRFEPIMDEAKVYMYNGLQDHYDPRNRHRTIVIKTKDGTWDPFKKSLKKSKLRKR